MKKSEQGKHIIAIHKSLKIFPIGDHILALYFESVTETGKAALVASAVRGHKEMSWDQLSMLAVSEGVSRNDLKNRVVPWLEESGLCYVKRRADGTFESLTSVVLKYDSVFTAAADLFDKSEPDEVARASVLLVALVCNMPLLEQEALQELATSFGEEAAKRAVGACLSYRVISQRLDSGNKILFSERVWKTCIAKAQSALSSQNDTARAIMLHFVEKVRKYQGFPEQLLIKEAKENNAAGLLTMCISVGLLNRTVITMADGVTRAFLTTPHFYADLDEEYGEDICDRVKIFLDSIRNGQHHSHSMRGKILDPQVLLSTLLNRGYIGPCTAIGRDYITSEKSGIVTVERGARERDSVLRLVQKDTVDKVYNVIATGTLQGYPTTPMLEGNMTDGTRFSSIQEQRAKLAEVPAQVQEAEADILRRLRER